MKNGSAITEAGILNRLVDPFDGTMTPELAQSLLGLRFDRMTLRTIDSLLAKNQRGTITLDERVALDKYVRTGKFIDILQVKARKALQSEEQRLMS